MLCSHIPQKQNADLHMFETKRLLKQPIATAIRLQQCRHAPLTIKFPNRNILNTTVKAR